MGQNLAEFDQEGVHLLGFSLAGEETFVVAPELNLGFDLGRAPRETLAVDHIFLSHGHMDHAAGVAYYFSQRMFLDNAPGHLYVPAGLEPPIRELLRVWARIDGHEPPANIHTVRPGDDITLRRDLCVRPFEVNHTCRRQDAPSVNALGYCVFETRQKLKPEYADLSGPQLVELKRDGVEITRRVDTPLVCYCGDTAPGAFLDLEYVRTARVLLLECTFFEAEHIRRARQGNHMHVSDLRAILPRLENRRVVLIHASRRTLLPEARAILRAELGADLCQRVSFLMEHRQRARGRGDRPAPVEPRGAGAPPSPRSAPVPPAS